ncbi:MAG: hypothetical protein KatS3mg023_3013 [Armatimonadota bacterium]|nr:MAG: hypothetical protein KatS3mg023_3013 [Armatimonadota bacterium]
MRAWLRFWAMCLRLILTSPLTWGMTGGVVLLAWKYSFPAWACSAAFASVAAVSLLFGIFFESGGALFEHVRLSRSGQPLLAAAAGAVLTLAVAIWAICMAIGRSH